MGRKSGITSGSYDPRIHRMHFVMNFREVNREREFHMMSKKKTRASYWTQRLTNAMSVLRAVDPANWERWYDNDENIPAEGTNREFSRLVEARVIALTGSFPSIKARARRGIFVWQDELGFFVYSKEVGKDPLYVIEFDSMEAAEAFLAGLPIDNCGYGVVLDLLPAPMNVQVEN